MSFLDDAQDILGKLFPPEVNVRVTVPRVEDFIWAAAEVLWVLDGDRIVGIEPGHFHAKLIDAMAFADMENLAKLAVGFPSLAVAVRQYKFEEGGVERLRKMAYLAHKTPDADSAG
jgi:hypothetical protein